MYPLAQTALMVAIFASDKGPGDPERASLMGEVGRVFARKGARMLCLAEKGLIPVPLITAARTAQGKVEVINEVIALCSPEIIEEETAPKQLPYWLFWRR